MVEDEMMVSLLVEEILADQKCVVVGPFDRIEGALKAARMERVDVAILDVNLAGVMSYPIADILAGRGIPFLFLSGYGDSAIPTAHPDWRVCSKPFKSMDLISKLLERAGGVASRV